MAKLQKPGEKPTRTGEFIECVPEAEKYPKLAR
jgi:hypothetical protein